jgi:hypothetical protein
VASPFLDAIRLVQALAAQGGFRVALIGGFALPFHGVRRATGDVDFLVDANGGDALHAGLVEAGHRSVHRSVEAANYRAGSGSGTAIDVLYARRPAALAMLARAPERATESGDPVRVVDVEGIVGLKLQAIANDPRRRRQDEADIVALLTEQLPSLDRALLAEYFRLFDREDALAEFLDEARRRRG